MQNSSLSCAASGSNCPAKNISEDERLFSVGAGTALTILGLSRRSLSGVILAAIGGSMIYRGTTGFCQLYSALGIDTAHPAQQGMPEQYRGAEARDEVEQASWESFPASDPPSWSGGAR